MTRTAHDAIAGAERRGDGRFENSLRRIADEIVADAVEHGRSHVVFRDLTEIREDISLEGAGGASLGDDVDISREEHAPRCAGSASSVTMREPRVAGATVALATPMRLKR